MPQEPTFEFLRDQIVGVDSTFTTPFGERLMVYCDYTASGRCLLFVENYLQSLQRTYANTHTEDDTTGRNMTQLLHEAEKAIKTALNAGPDSAIIAVGTGATGAINKLQQILGVYCPPATRARYDSECAAFFGASQSRAYARHMYEHQPVVFVGPFEHHSNDVSWREGLATVVPVRLASDGGIDLAHLEELLTEPAYQGRVRIGSFSAASNVTGIRTPVNTIAALLHRYGAIACFDYAASAPYVAIDMNPPAGPEGDGSLDAVFISPHKYLGGPGSAGVLVFNKRLYRRDLAPTIAAGGTVDYVSATEQDFIPDIEEREKAGTPGTLQVLKAALAMQVKDWIGVARIEAREHALLERAMRRWQQNAHIEILGNPDPARRIAIVSFNVTDGADRYLHAKFVTALLNDLFGIQSRAGCSCAGPYGHQLLDIDQSTSDRIRHWVRHGIAGIKPGWCRIGFHYAMDDAEVEFVIAAVEFIGAYGHCFIPSYRFEPTSGTWTHRQAHAEYEHLSLESALSAGRVEPSARSATDRAALYRQFLAEARRHADALGPCDNDEVLAGELGQLQTFALSHESVSGN